MKPYLSPMRVALTWVTFWSSYSDNWSIPNALDLRLSRGLALVHGPVEEQLFSMKNVFEEK